MEIDPVAPPFEMAPAKWRTGRFRIGRLALWRATAPLVRSAPRAGARSLDAGCGLRPFDALLRRRGYQPIGVDAREVTGDCRAALPALPFRSGVFALVLCINVLQYVLDPGAACSELYRVLDPGGDAVVVVPFCEPLDEDDYWRWTDHSARNLMRESGFHDIRVNPILPTASTLLHLFALSSRKVAPAVGDAVGSSLDLMARAAFRSGNYRLTGGYAVRGRKPV